MKNYELLTFKIVISITNVNLTSEFRGAELRLWLNKSKKDSVSNFIWDDRTNNDYSKTRIKPKIGKYPGNARYHFSNIELQQKVAWK